MTEPMSIKVEVVDRIDRASAYELTLACLTIVRSLE